jgi:sugar transferase (PEP-CTERM/EpsH1 system associated)
MRILFLTHRVPFPPDKGDRIRSYNIIKWLARHHSISLMSVSHEPAHPKSYEVLREYCDSVEVVKINSKLSSLRSGLCLLTKNPLTLSAFYSQRFQKAVRRTLEKTKFDLIYIYSSSMAQYVLDATPIPKLMDFIDVDSQKWFDYAKQARGPMRAIYYREGISLRAYERLVAAQCTHNLVTSKTELKLFKTVIPNAPVMAVPNGVEMPKEPLRSYRPNKLVFVGAMDYFPNVDAMLYFTGEIFPLIRKEIADVQLYIVGRNPPSRIRDLGKLKNVTVTGRVQEIGPFLNDAAASIVPLRIARGMQNKILEAMAHGVPVIATTIALEGIEARPGTELLLGDNARAFADMTIAVLRDKALRQSISSSAYSLVQNKYDWEQNIRGVIHLISRLCTH